MPTYKTPGVYVEEISTLPPSVAEVSTAIPVFIGYTERAGLNGSNLTNTPTRISTFLEFTTTFGGPKPMPFAVTIDNNSAVTSVEKSDTLQYLMYYSVNLYFKNGGGPCYIVSVGDYAAIPDTADFSDALAAIEKEDEPTLILLTDAVNLANSSDYYSLCQDALAQCGKLKDRFTIFDMLDSEGVSGFRNGIGTNNLRYGAAYHPYLGTSLSYTYDEEDVLVSGVAIEYGEYVTDPGGNGLKILYIGDYQADAPTVTIELIADTSGAQHIDFEIAASGEALTIRLPGGTTSSPTAGSTPTQIRDAWNSWKLSNDSGAFEIDRMGTYSVRVDTAVVDASFGAASESVTSMESLKTSATAIYNNIKVALSSEKVTLPPSAAIAGVYASVDRERGVWKAPANVSLASVIGPTIKITHEEQEGLNVDPASGKSINAIRAFNGKGTLVWGARTLAGNDNEWRYVSVRRLFNTIEESTQKATAFAVFEPNDTTTWLKVKAMIESYLYGLWEQGALAGPTPEAAYFVNIGLGKTMTTQDVLEGRMNVEIGIAAVRPAEFVILKFTHKLQEA